MDPALPILLERMRISAPGDEISRKKGFELLNADRIEDRLENLKRKQTWISWLMNSDACQMSDDENDSDWIPGESSGDESDSEDERNILPPTQNNLFHAVFWTPIVVLFSPLVLLLSCCSGQAKHGYWPLGCKSPFRLLLTALGNFATLAAIAISLFTWVCNRLPEFQSIDIDVFRLKFPVLLHRFKTCGELILEQEFKHPECWSMLPAVGMVLLLSLAVLSFHRKLSKMILLFSAGAWIASHAEFAMNLINPRPRITRVEPNFAFADEEIMVAVMGNKLHSGGFVAWVPYGGCASMSPVGECDKQLASKFQSGVVTATFSDVDEYIPCYKNPPNPLMAEDYECFDDVRLRVHDPASFSKKSRSEHDEL